MPDPMQSLKAALARKEELAGRLARVERMKAEGGLEEDQYEAFRRKYAAEQQAAEAAVESAQRDLRRALEEQQYRLTVCRQKQKQEEARFASGEVDADTHLAQWQVLQKDMRTAEVEIERLERILAADSPAALEGLDLSPPRTPEGTSPGLLPPRPHVGEGRGGRPTEAAPPSRMGLDEIVTALDHAWDGRKIAVFLGGCVLAVLLLTLGLVGGGSAAMKHGPVPLVVGGLVGSLAAYLVWIATLGTLSRMAYWEYLSGGPTTVGAALTFALQHLATLAVTPIALLLLVGIGYTLCAAIGYAVGRIPGSLGQFFTCVLIGPVFLVELLGFYLLTQAAFFTPAIVAAEQTGVGGTLQKLFLLVRRSLGRLIGYQALVWLVGVAVLGALLAGLTVVSSSGLVPMLAVQPLLKGLSPTALATLTSGPSVGPLLMLGLVLAALLCYPVIYLITAYVAVYLAVQPEEEAVLPLPAPRTAFAKGVGAGWVILSLALALWSGLTPAQGRGVGSATQARGERDDATWFRFECGDPATQARGERGEPAQEGGSAPPAISTSGEKGWPGLWAGLLEPFQVARSQSQRDQCLGNLRQIGVAVLMYTQDHNGNLPDQENWTEPLLPYLKDPSIFACPEAGSGVGYTFNQDLRGANLDALENPVDTVLAFDGAGGWGPVTTAILRHENPSHDKGANVLFADGHVKWCSRDNLQRWVSGPVEWRTPPGPLPPGTEGKMPYRLPPPGSGPGTPPGAAAGPGTPPGVGPGSKEAAPLGIPAFQKAQVPGPEVSNPQPSPDQGQASRLREEARQLKSRGDWGTALVKVDEALRLDPNNAEGYYIRAWIQLEHGAQAEASADFQKVLQLAPGTVWAREAEQALARLSAP